MNSLDHTVAEIDTQSFWTNLIVNKSYSTSLLISLFMIPVIHIIVFLVRPSEVIRLEVLLLIL